MKISIFGLGYVGAVSLACLARDGHEVVGVDIDRNKLELIKSGKSPIIEEGIQELIENVVDQGRVRVTDNAEEAINQTELSFVCVGTPSLANGDQDLGAVTRLCKQIGSALSDKADHHTIVIRSTVLPGTVEESVIPLLEDSSGKRAGADFSVAFQPEFLREGSSIKDYDNPPMTVVGTTDTRATEKLKSIYGSLPCDFVATEYRTAETLKYACNAFHALKISFANEIGRICQVLGADSHSVMQLVCRDKQLNISPAYLRPGFAFGGSCLPKDLRALLYLAKRGDVEVPTLVSLLQSNRVHLEHALDLVLQTGKRNVAVVGLSFKSGTDDLRESPMVTLVEQMIGKGINIKIYDPEVRVSQLIGANRDYIEKVVPHIGDLIGNTLEEVLTDAEVIVLGLQGKDIAEAVAAHDTPDTYVLDLVGIDLEPGLSGNVQGVCW